MDLFSTFPSISQPPETIETLTGRRETRGCAPDLEDPIVIEDDDDDDDDDDDADPPTHDASAFCESPGSHGSDEKCPNRSPNGDKHGDKRFAYDAKQSPSSSSQGWWAKAVKKKTGST